MRATIPGGGSCLRAFLLSSIIVIAVGLAPGTAAARQIQPLPAPSDTIYEVSVTDGSSFFARVTQVDGDRLTFTTIAGIRLEIDRSQIRSFRAADGRLVGGEFWRRDPNTTRLFFTSTGRSLRAGEGYVGTYLIVLPFVAFGVTDDFTFAAGAPVTLGELEPFYIAPKLRVFHTESAEVSVGTLLFFTDDERVGVAYGVGTFGSRDQALTLGLGFGYSGADFESQPVAVVGGESRVSRKVKLITENYFLPGETGVVFSGGVRILGERFSTDLAVVGAAGDGDAGCCLPLVNFSYLLGHKRDGG